MYTLKQAGITLLRTLTVTVVVLIVAIAAIVDAAADWVAIFRIIN